MQIRPIEIISDDVDALIQLSRRYMAELYPPESNHQEDPQRLLAADIYFIGAYLERKLLGIGAVKKVDASPAYGEIKNLFVDPRQRGQGVSRLIMSALEQFLIDNNVMLCRLETGPEQAEAIGLYQGLGYHECPPFGDYKPDPLSVFMEKELEG
ncbi:MAG: GNAT family N-acetyltransferase [Proteobacteria bacterium]|nr:GNAT family N-acetyltransferase [Pseudomonadota bacterium]